jgi:hypothetical protein
VGEPSEAPFSSDGDEVCRTSLSSPFPDQALVHASPLQNMSSALHFPRPSESYAK